MFEASFTSTHTPAINSNIYRLKNNLLNLVEITVCHKSPAGLLMVSIVSHANKEADLLPNKLLSQQDQLPDLAQIHYEDFLAK